MRVCKYLKQEIERWKLPLPSHDLAWDWESACLQKLEPFLERKRWVGCHGETLNSWSHLKAQNHQKKLNFIEAFCDFAETFCTLSNPKLKFWFDCSTQTRARHTIHGDSMNNFPDCCMLSAMSCTVANSLHCDDSQKLNFSFAQTTRVKSPSGWRLISFPSNQENSYRKVQKATRHRQALPDHWTLYVHRWNLDPKWRDTR